MGTILLFLLSASDGASRYQALHEHFSSQTVTSAEAYTIIGTLVLVIVIAALQHFFHPSDDSAHHRH